MVQRHTEQMAAEQVQERFMKRMLPRKMMIANIICSAFGAGLMFFMRHYLVMAVFLLVLVSMGVSMLLRKGNRISVETACLIPMLVLCFVYTPVSWFTFDGLLGSTPYQIILFVSIIILTHYRKIQPILLSAYGVLTGGLILHWFLTTHVPEALSRGWGVLISFIVALVIISYFLIKVKAKNAEIGAILVGYTMRDQLTGLYNRHAVASILAQMEKRYQEERMDYIVIMMDIDNFKTINDEYGHVFGDSVLKNLAQRVQGVVREGDCAARYGGDEILLILPISAEEDTMPILERIEAATRTIPGYAMQVIVSMGSARRGECETSDALVALADERMYVQKRRTAEHLTPVHQTRDAETKME